MKTELVKIKHNGMWWVAILSDGGREFNINADNLEIRIKNLERQHMDAGVERAALAQLRKCEAESPSPLVGGTAAPCTD